MPKALVNKIEKLNTAVWSEAIRVEKLKNSAEDIALKIEDIEAKPGRGRALAAMRKVQSDLFDIELKLEEIAGLLDDAVDDLEN